MKTKATYIGDNMSKNCSSCGSFGTLFKSLGGASLCHKCAHELGLLHKHPDIEDTTHCLDGFASKAEIEAHLKAYREE